MTFLEFAGARTIRDRKNKPIPFVPNFAQQCIYTDVLQRWDYDRAYHERLALPRAIFLKSRQLGISLWTQLYSYFLAHEYGYSTLTMAHTDPDTLDLFQRFSRFWHALEIKEKQKQNERATRRRAEGDLRRESQIALDFENGGEMICRTAGGRGAGRSHTFQFLHLTEVAEWDNAETTFEGVMGAATHAGCMIESTANGSTGRGKWFHDFWYASTDGYTGYIPLFFPWWWEQSYREDHRQSQQGPGSISDLTAEELYLVTDHRVTLDQLCWRRAWIAGPMAKGDVNKFRRQFPATPEEAFTTSVESAFNRELVIRLLERCRATPGAAEGYGYKWEEPDPKMEYVMGGDVAEGIGRHSSALCVLTRTEPPRQVYEWHHNQTGPVELGYIAARIARMYNNATIVLEINNHGLTTMSKIQDIGGLQIWLRRDWDHIGREYIMRPGWKTTGGQYGTRVILFDHLAQRINTDATGVRSAALANEFMGYAPEHEDRVIDDSHFDRMIAYALALIGLGSRPAIPEQVEQPKAATIVQKMLAQVEREEHQRMKEW